MTRVVYTYTAVVDGGEDENCGDNEESERDSGD